MSYWGMLPGRQPVSPWAFASSTLLLILHNSDCKAASLRGHPKSLEAKSMQGSMIEVYSDDDEKTNKQKSVL